MQPDRLQRECGQTRRTHDRDASQRRILDATWRLFEQGGPFAGINMQEVADDAGVNRSLVYQYFGTREQLLRATLASRLDEGRPSYSAGYDRPFAERRRHAFRVTLARPRAVHLLAQLVLAGDDEVKILPMLDAALPALARDQADGSLPPDADAVVMHAMTVVTYVGYAILRERLSAELGIPQAELDRRAFEVYGRMVDGLAAAGEDVEGGTREASPVRRAGSRKGRRADPPSSTD